VVRGLAALLVAVGYFAACGELPAVDGDAGRLLAGCIGAVMVGLAALAPLAGRDDPLGVALFGLGAALLTVALVAADAGAIANPAEALLAASAGLLFAWAFAVPAAVAALPLLVAGIDAFSVLTGPAEPLPSGDSVDVLTFELPQWGGGGAVAHLAVLDATFVAMFAAWALRFDLRPRLAITLMLVALAAAIAVGVAADRAVPALPFVAAAFLAASPRRLLTLVRRDAEA
jgi:hypothetical protein